MDQQQIRELVKKMEKRIKEYQTSDQADFLGLNEYDAIEAVLQEELGSVGHAGGS